MNSGSYETVPHVTSETNISIAEKLRVKSQDRLEEFIVDKFS